MKRQKKKFRWAMYEGLRQVEREGAFHLLKWAVDSLPPPWDSGWKGVGRKPRDARALTVVTLWQEMEGKAERAYTADLAKDKERLNLLGLTEAPHRTSLYRTRRKLSEEYLKLLNEKVLEGLRPAKRVAADATGFRQSKRDSAWSSSDEEGRREYVKLNALFDLESGSIWTMEATEGRKHEGKCLEVLLADLDNIELFVGDSAFLSRENCRLIAEKGGTPYIKPKKNSTTRSLGCWPWKFMVTLFRQHPRLFNRVYGLRQRAEAGWHSLKSMVGDLIRSRTVQTIKAEIWSKIVCYNLIWAIRRSHGF